MSKELNPRVRPIKKFSAVGAAIVLAATASVGNVAAKDAIPTVEAVNPNTGFPEVVLAEGVPAAILPETLSLVVVRETRKADPKNRLNPELPKPQTEGNLPDPNYVSHSRVFRG